MAAVNFAPSLGFAWRPGFDNPADGYHVTPGDTGGGTLGGVIEATWAGAVKRGLVAGLLRNATRDQLATVLRDEFWGPACDSLPSGLDFMLFNGRMMSGQFPKIFQRCTGLIGQDVDGVIGIKSAAVAHASDSITLIHAMVGVHYAYLTTLSSWPEFGNGWTARLLAARTFGLALIAPVPGANPSAQR